MSNDRPMTFNGPLEAGIRAVAVLGFAYPQRFDIHRLTAYDYLLVRTSVIDGPADLHPPVPIQAPATEVRRKVVQDALNIMMTRDLIVRYVSGDGFEYGAGDSAAIFLDSMTTPYLFALKERAAWLTSRLENLDDAAFEQMMSGLFDRWLVELQEPQGPSPLASS